MNKLIPDYFDYKRQSQADQGLIYDIDGKPLYEKTLLSCNAIHTSLFDASAKLKKQSARALIAGNIDASSIEIVDPNTGSEFVLVKVAQGIIVKIAKDQLLAL